MSIILSLNKFPILPFIYSFIHSFSVQTIQNLAIQLAITETTFVCFLYKQTMYKLHKIDTNINRIIYAAADVCFMYIYKTS